MHVTLSPAELRFAAQTGAERRIDAIAKARKGAHGFNRDDYWQIDIEGACAELAAAKSLGLTYAPIVDRLDTLYGDIGPGLQVRSTKYPTGHLLVHDSDSDEDRFILVTGASPQFETRGWAYGRESKLDCYWTTHKGRGAYWVPQDGLRPMEDLARRLDLNAA